MAVFAIYSEDDFSLNFYKRETLPSVGEIFNGLTVTKIYNEDIENILYSKSIIPKWRSDKTIAKIKLVNFVDGISPVSIVAWFREGTLISNVDIAKLDTSKCTDFYAIFYNCANLRNIDVSNFNTSKVTSFEYMFYGCIQATITGFENWDISSATSMRSMFYRCSSTLNFDLSNWKIPATLKNVKHMFNRCGGYVDFTGWDTSHITEMEAMFANSNFTYLDLSSFNVSSVTKFGGMFYESLSLKTILVSYNWNESFAEGAVTDGMFENCYSLMGDVFYKEIADAAEDGDIAYMGGDYATTIGGYFSVKYNEDNTEEENIQTYFISSATLKDTADAIRSLLKIPQRIKVNKFKTIIGKQINSTQPAILKFIDSISRVGSSDAVAIINYLDINLNSVQINLNKFHVISTIVKGSIVTLSDTIYSNGNTQFSLSGDIEQISDTSFIIKGDCIIEVTNKSEEQPVTFSLRAPKPVETNFTDCDDDDGKEELI